MGISLKLYILHTLQNYLKYYIAMYVFLRLIVLIKIPLNIKCALTIYSCYSLEPYHVRNCSRHVPNILQLTKQMCSGVNEFMCFFTWLLDYIGCVTMVTSPVSSKFPVMVVNLSCPWPYLAGVFQRKILSYCTATCQDLVTSQSPLLDDYSLM